MQLSARFVILLNVIVAATAIPVFDMTVDGNGALSPELTEARNGVRTQIPKMLTTLTNAEGGDAAAIKRVTTAFGPSGVSKIGTIRNNINQLNNLNMPVSSQTPEQLGPINARTPFPDRESANHPLQVGPVEFGQNFYHMSPTASDNVKAELKKQNIATVLHEATHYAPFHASDHYDPASKQMVPLGVAGPDTTKYNAGYANRAPVVAMPDNPIKEGRFVKSFKDIKKEGDAENNADSYAVFGAVCDAEMARLRKRALMEGDLVAYHLAKRGGASCKLPANYFAKKAAAAKAAKEKAAGATTGSQKTAKGEKSLAAGKGGVKGLGKAAKSTSQKTSKSGLGKGTARSSKTAKLSRTKASMSKGSKALSKSGLTKSGSKKAAKAVGKATGRAALSKVKGGKALSKASSLSRGKGGKALSKASGLSRGKGGKALSKASSLSKGKGGKALSKASGLSRGKGGKALSKASSLSKATGGKSLSKASKGLASKGKTSNARTSGSRSSSKKGTGGAVKQAGGRGGKQTSKSPSKLTGSRSSSKATSSKAPSASRNQAGGQPKGVRTNGSPSSQRISKVPTTSKQAEKAVAKTVVKQAANALSNPAVVPKKKGGKP